MTFFKFSTKLLKKFTRNLNWNCLKTFCRNLLQHPIFQDHRSVTLKKKYLRNSIRQYEIFFSSKAKKNEVPNFFSYFYQKLIIIRIWNSLRFLSLLWNFIGLFFWKFSLSIFLEVSHFHQLPSRSSRPRFT